MENGIVQTNVKYGCDFKRWNYHHYLKSVNPLNHSPQSLLQPNQQRIALLILNHTVLLCIILFLSALLTHPQLRTAISIFNRRVLHATTSTLETIELFVTLEVVASRARAFEAITTVEGFVTQIRRTSCVDIGDLTMMNSSE